MAPVSTRGRTAGFPHSPPLQGLKPEVLEIFIWVGADHIEDASDT